MYLCSHALYKIVLSVAEDAINIPANCPDLIGIVPIFEFQNLKKSGHSDFQEEKNTFSFVKIWNQVVKNWS